MLQTTMWFQWLPRLENLGACCDRLSRLFAEIQPLPYMDRWFRLGRSRKDALRFEITDRSPKKLLQFHRHLPKDTRESTEPITGYFFHAWNGQPDDTSMSLSVNSGCGFAGGSLMHTLPNDVTLKFPRPFHPQIQSHATMHSLLRAINNTYSIDYAKVANAGLTLPLKDLRRYYALPGWITWFRGPVLPVPDLGGDATVEPFEGGALITLGERPLDDDSPEDMARLRDAWLKMRAAGYPV